MIALVSQGGKIAYNVKNYFIDNEEDLKNLPYCAFGSTATDVSTGSVYVLNNNYKWIKSSLSAADGNTGSTNCSCKDEQEITVIS